MGKGDTFRKVNKKRYNSNFDSIKWKNYYGKEIQATSTGGNNPQLRELIPPAERARARARARAK